MAERRRQFPGALYRIPEQEVLSAALTRRNSRGLIDIDLSRRDGRSGVGQGERSRVG
ncbi:hypothetical protein CLV29_1181 [Naumannella halotolerans]|uniref:Uncharacterized protein n=1 Tax=Naumannella halotolerans TaxID=993414 RepID=A0A4R7JAX5_9ACTN|nr:hypothetical protein CLV29_1181 [Naumannella halotolerans]